MGRLTHLNSKWYTPLGTLYPTTTHHTTGFAVLLDTHQARTAVQATVVNLVAQEYFDEKTNVVFVDMTVYGDSLTPQTDT